jgi:hypothetical protein
VWRFGEHFALETKYCESMYGWLGEEKMRKKKKKEESRY